MEINEYPVTDLLNLSIVSLSVILYLGVSMGIYFSTSK